MPADTPFSAARAGFEAVVKGMQASLKKRIAEGKINQRGVDIETDRINKLVDFWRMATELERQHDDLKLSHERLYDSLQEGTQRLVYWCQLHRAHPKQAFFYPEAELKKMVDEGRRFGRTEDLYLEAEEDSSQFATNPYKKQLHNQQTQKYLTTRALCSKTLPPTELPPQKITPPPSWMPTNS